MNVAFGLAHLYQGPSGVIQATVGGVLLGILYVATGRNLVAPIIAHGLGNSIDFTVMYLGLYPGVGVRYLRCRRTTCCERARKFRRRERADVTSPTRSGDLHAGAERGLDRATSR